MALSPDDRADGLEQEDFGIEIKTFKPTEDGREEHINQWIFEEIVNLEKRYDKFGESYGQMNRRRCISYERKRI